MKQQTLSHWPRPLTLAICIIIPLTAKQPIQKNSSTKLCKKEVQLTPRKVLYKRMVAPKKPPIKSAQTAKVVLDQTEEARKTTLLQKTVQYMTLEELREALVYATAINSSKDLIIKYIERILTLSNDQQEKQDLKLKLAHYYFDQLDMKKAGKLFREYIKLYPGCKHRDEAEYKEILSRFHARLRPPCDQSKTIKILKLANNYIATAQTHKRSYVQEVKKLLHTCHEDIFTYEYEIIRQYMIRQQYIAAQTRLVYIKNEVLPNLKEKEPLVCELELALAQQQTAPDQKAEITQKIAQFKATWPDFKPTLLTHEMPKKPYVYQKRI